MFKKLFAGIIFSFFISFLSKAQSPGAIIDVQHYTFSIQLTDADNVINGQADISVLAKQFQGCIDCQNE